LHEAGLAHEFVSLQLGSQEDNGTQSDAYKQKNPQGKVPTLVHDNFVLTESAAILNYIDTLAEKAFIPTTAQERAKYDELSFFVLAELEQPLWTTGKHRFAIPEAHRVAEIFATARWEFDKAINALEKLLPQREFALGDTFTFADILLAHTFNWANRFEFELPAQHLEYRDRLYQRKACQAAIAEFS
jgi:glutathione S-transferase